MPRNFELKGELASLAVWWELSTWSINGEVAWCEGEQIYWRSVQLCSPSMMSCADRDRYSRPLSALKCCLYDLVYTEDGHLVSGALEELILLCDKARQTLECQKGEFERALASKDTQAVAEALPDSLKVSDIRKAVQAITNLLRDLCTYTGHLEAVALRFLPMAKTA